MRWRSFGALLAAAALWAGPAAADDPSIDAFAGQWVGKVTVETLGPTDFPNTVRETGVTVTPDGKGGFSLEWSTIRRESGDREDPEETVQENQLTFPAGDKPGRWLSPRTEGGVEWFARLDGPTLTVSGFALLPDGQAELQTYRRTLEGDAMGLTYTRIVDGDLKRRASGALTRFAR